jgi:hypothetical protein
MNPRTVMPPRDGTKIGTALRRWGEVHPPMALLLSISKCAFFWQTAGSSDFMRGGKQPVHCDGLSDPKSLAI